MNNIRVLRKKAGITQEELGKRLNLSQEAISQYESGTRTPNIFTAKAIAVILEVSIEELFKFERRND